MSIYCCSVNILVIYVTLCICSVSARQRQVENDLLLKHALSSVVVNYPRWIFSSDRDWRKLSQYSDELANISDQSYTTLAKAQDAEDILLYENWFYGMSDGVIMESGAVDGLSFSTSYMFEKYANWTAINIEGNPTTYRPLKWNRPNAINIFSALCSETRTLHYVDLNGLVVRGFLEFMSPDFLEKYHPDIYHNETKIEDLAEMHCMPVKKLLRQLGVKHIDVWVLDVEGAEDSVLMGTDFDDVFIRAIVMEAAEDSRSKNRRRLRILRSKGYQCYRVVRNFFCKHRLFQPSTKPDPNPPVLRERMNWKWNGLKWIDLTPELSLIV
mmetsp:Transcript_2413/g.3701  ORF Transcript_2413/g.3701 Transcript_2413/m.3701 type:complete len:326 (-) Transcript_2413:104-1081(-)